MLVAWLPAASVAATVSVVFTRRLLLSALRALAGSLSVTVVVPLISFALLVAVCLPAAKESFAVPASLDLRVIVTPFATLAFPTLMLTLGAVLSAAGAEAVGAGVADAVGPGEGVAGGGAVIVIVRVRGGVSNGPVKPWKLISSVPT